MKVIIKLIATAIIVSLLSYFLPGVSVDGFGSSIVVVIVLAVLNFLVKPILQLIAMPINILTLGLFLFVINALIIMLCGSIVTGFQVNGFIPALLFSLILSILQSILDGIIGSD